MTSPGSRPGHGRRDNGLDAPGFVPLLDLDPRVGEHLLDVLALEGIAAYLQPSADLNPIIRSTTLPSRPIDRLWVDSERADDARAVLAQVEMEDSGSGAEDSAADGVDAVDVDAEWEQIVAGWHEPAASSVPSSPAAEEATRDPSATRGTAATDDVLGRSDSGSRGESGAWDGGSTIGSPSTDGLRPVGTPTPGPRDSVLAEPSDDDLIDPDVDPANDEGYTPPPPPPLPRLSSQAVLGLLTVVAGFLLFFKSDLLGIGQDTTMALGVAGILGGSVILIYRLRDGLNADDDPDDGAVV